MDAEAVEKLKGAGLKVDQPEMLRVAIQRDENKKVMNPRDDVAVMGNEGLDKAEIAQLGEAIRAVASKLVEEIGVPVDVRIEVDETTPLGRREHGEILGRADLAIAESRALQAAWRTSARDLTIISPIVTGVISTPSRS